MCSSKYQSESVGWVTATAAQLPGIVCSDKQRQDQLSCFSCVAAVCLCAWKGGIVTSTLASPGRSKITEKTFKEVSSDSAVASSLAGPLSDHLEFADATHPYPPSLQQLPIVTLPSNPVTLPTLPPTSPIPTSFPFPPP